MTGRDPEEAGRAATTLELFFDLVFVVAVAFAASAMHHDLVEGIVGESVARYAQVFFAIWWAWMNFTWFASAYDTDDGPYRLTTFVGITGALILAAGVPEAFDTGDFTVVTIGYVVMRLALVSLWIRAGRADTDHSPTAFRYATGVTVAQLGWVLLLFAPEAMATPGFIVLIILELAVPIWAERQSPTTWHAEHIEERYGLFTIIVLGESILASSIAIQSALGDSGLSLELTLVVGGGLLTVFSMWWLYFERPRSEVLASLRKAFVWGYGHYFVWAAAAAVGAGLAVVIDHAAGHGHIGELGAGAAFAIPTAVYVTTLWVLNYMPGEGGIAYNLPALIAVVLILLTPLTGQAVLLTGLILAALLGIESVTVRRSVTG